MLTVFSTVGMAYGQTEKEAIKRVEYVLCPDQKPVGKAVASATPAVREVTVKDFSDAHAMLLRMCKPRDIREEKKAGNMFYTYTLPGGSEKLVLTDKVKPGTKEVAVLEVQIESLKSKVSEVRFVK